MFSQACLEEISLLRHFASSVLSFFLVNLTRNEEHKRVVDFIYVMKAEKESFV